MNIVYWDFSKSKSAGSQNISNIISLPRLKISMFWCSMMKRRSILYFPLHHSVSSIKDHKSFYTGITLQQNLQRSTTLIIKKWSPSFNVYHNFIALQKHMFWFSPQAQYKHFWEIRSLFLIKCSKFQLSV